MKRADLLVSAMSEVVRREPTYLERFAVRVCLEGEVERYCQVSLVEERERVSVIDGLASIVGWLESRGVRVQQSGDMSDAVGRLFLDSGVDTWLMERGALRLRPIIDDHKAPDALTRDYHLCGGDATPRYLVRGKGERTLVVVNAVGVSLRPWERLLTDANQSFRVLLVESRGSDLMRGGLQAALDVADDVEGIAAVLRRESIDDAIVLGWCNGARIAIGLAAACPERIGGLVLLSPTMMGYPGAKPRCSVFEETLDTVFQSVRSRPSLAPLFAETLRAYGRPDWDRMDEEQRGLALARLPSVRHTEALRAPMSTGPSLVNYANRGESDARFPLDRALGEVVAPLLVITGGDDDVVSNDLTANVLADLAHPAMQLQVSAAGHYINDLQYCYLIAMLEAWSRGDCAAPHSARVTVVGPKALHES